MGILTDARSGRTHPLTTETTIGRSRSADLCIRENFVSGHHAALLWQGQWWELKDLGSHNGTSVEERVVPPGTRRRLKRGDKLIFGQAAATWILSDDGPPRPQARIPGRPAVVGREGVLALPSAEDPQLCVVLTRTGHWELERGDSVRRVRDHEQFEFRGSMWTLRLPASAIPTRATDGARSLSLEQVTLRVERAAHGTTVVYVSGASESFSFEVGAGAKVLGALARARVGGVEGWVERQAVLDELSITINSLNVAVFRLRRQFADAGFTDAAHIVERRKGRLRLGCARVDEGQG